MKKSLIFKLFVIFIFFLILSINVYASVYCSSPPHMEGIYSSANACKTANGGLSCLCAVSCWDAGDSTL